MTQHQETTNKEKVIKLESSIEQVMWSRQMASPGGNVGVEVFTYHVGDGADIEITLKGHDGDTFDTLDCKIAGNHVGTELTVPSEARTALFAEVKLPKHGLSSTSGPLLLTPPIELSNVKWDKEEARRGEVLTLSADVSDVPDGMQAEITIWAHDADAEHELIARLPALVINQQISLQWEFQYYEDTDDIPVAVDGESGYQAPEYFFIVSISGKTAQSPLLAFKDWVEIYLKNDQGEIIPDARYILTLPDGEEREGQVDQNGYAKEEGIAPGKITIEFPDLPGAAVSG